MVKLGSLDIASYYIGETAVPKTYKCEDTVFSAGGTGFTADVLIIGGGGGGGYSFGGGGGAGGYREFTKKYFTGINYTVTIGAGGAGGTSLKGANGNNSFIERIAHGGGGGGGTSSGAGQDGGSGGGASGTGAAGSSTNPRCNGSSQGNSGFTNSGGGGGAGAAATNVNGGDGSSSSITGSSVIRGGGGGGGPSGTGGSGGGGDGRNNGAVNTGGGGGGGGGIIQSPQEGGNGGSGLVVIKFPDTYSITIGGGLTYTSSTSGGYTTVQFTAGTDTISFSSFNPASISGLQLWLDADDSETITLNGSTVSQWDDKSGNGYHCVQGTASNQPTYVTAAQNGKNVVRLDGGNDYMQNSTNTIVGGSNARTVFVACKNTDASGITYPFGLGTRANVGSGQIFFISSEVAVRVSFGNIIWSTSLYSSAGIITIQTNGTNVTQLLGWLNGSSLSVSSSTSATLNTQVGYMIGDSIGSSTWYGDVMEIIVYDSELSTANRESVESYLSTKWGIS